MPKIFFLIFLFLAFLGESCKKPDKGDNSDSGCHSLPPSSSPFDYDLEEAPKNWEAAVFNPFNNNEIAYFVQTPIFFSNVYKASINDPGDTLMIAGNPLYYPKWSKNGWILMGSLGGLLYKVKQSGDSLTPFNTFTSMNFYPDWSPDGKKIIFRGESSKVPGSLFMMNSDGSNEKEFLSIGDYPIWSPDGSKIAFAVDPYIGYADTLSRQITVVKYLNGDAINGMAWFPDSKWIIYTANSGLYKINIDTKETILFRTNCDSRGYGAPSVSSDGTQILVTRTDSKIIPPNTKFYEVTIWLMNADGTNEHEVELK